MSGKIVLKTELAAILGKTIKTLVIWQNEGMPYFEASSTGKGNTYNTAEVISWMIRRETKSGPDVNTERAKLAAAQTESAYLRNEERKGNLVTLETAKAVVERAAFAIRQKIVNSDLPKADKQALLTDIASLGASDFTGSPDDVDEDETKAEQENVES
jgi:phage terminase Nu1 subunit (DNA packaging protein)